MDKFGVALGYIDTEEGPVEAPPKLQITNKELLHALGNKTEFDMLYITLSQKAMRGLYAAGGLRSVRLIRCDVASIHFYRGRWDKAREIFQSMIHLDMETMPDDPMIPTLDSWTAIDVDILVKLAKCYKELGYVDEFARATSFLLLAHDRLPHKHLETMVGQLQSLEQQPEIVLELDITNMASVQILPQSADSDDFFIYDDGRALQAKIVYHPSVALNVHSVRLIMCGAQGQDIVFSSRENLILYPGINLERLACANDVPSGQYVAGKLLVDIGTTIYFHWFLRPGMPKQLFAIRESDECVKITVSTTFNARVDLSRDTLGQTISSSKFNPMSWAGPRFSPVSPPNDSLLLRIYTRDNIITANSELQFTSNTGLRISDTEMCHIRVLKDGLHESMQRLINDEEPSPRNVTVNEAVGTIKDERLILPIQAGRYSIIEFHLPFEDRSWSDPYGKAAEPLAHNLNIVYGFENESGQRHVTTSSVQVMTSLPLSCEQYILHHEKR